MPTPIPFADEGGTPAWRARHATHSAPRFPTWRFLLAVAALPFLLAFMAAASWLAWMCFWGVMGPPGAVIALVGIAALAALIRLHTGMEIGMALCLISVVGWLGWCGLCSRLLAVAQPSCTHSRLAKPRHRMIGRQREDGQLTIAMCYVSPEGVVLGADSTASMMVPEGGFHYLNYNQKLFQIGEAGTLGVITWGLASLRHVSHRTQIARLADNLEQDPPKDVADVAERWIDQFWAEYSANAGPEIASCRALDAKAPHDPSASDNTGMRTRDEERDYQQLKLGLVVGFCLGGCHSDRTPYAYEIIFDPLKEKPSPVPIAIGDTRCWGAPKIFNRLILGIDGDIRESILSSGKWTGSREDLNHLVTPHQLYNPTLPIRDAIDFVHACIHSTIKALKFSYLSQICGGPIELAVITTDRPFRWVRHKDWDAAISEGHTL